MSTSEVVPIGGDPPSVVKTISPLPLEGISLRCPVGVKFFLLVLSMALNGYNL